MFCDTALYNNEAVPHLFRPVFDDLSPSLSSSWAVNNDVPVSVGVIFQSCIENTHQISSKFCTIYRNDFLGNGRRVPDHGFTRSCWTALWKSDHLNRDRYPIARISYLDFSCPLSLQNLASRNRPLIR